MSIRLKERCKIEILKRFHRERALRLECVVILLSVIQNEKHGCPGLCEMVRIAASGVWLGVMGIRRNLSSSLRRSSTP